jgi:hypothetical protein
LSTRTREAKPRSVVGWTRLLGRGEEGMEGQRFGGLWFVVVAEEGDQKGKPTKGRLAGPKP